MTLSSISEKIRDWSFYSLIGFLLWSLVLISALHSTMISLVLVIASLCVINRYFSHSLHGMIIRTGMGTILFFVAFMYGGLKQFPKDFSLLLMMYAFSILIAIVFSYIIVKHSLEKDDATDSDHSSPPLLY